MKYLPHKQAPWIILASMLLHLAYGHIYRQLYSYLEFGLDWTLPQMMMVVKLTSLAWAYHDGQIPEEKLDRPEWKQKRVEKLPSFLEYYSFVFFFVGFLTGPFAEFKHYIAFTDRSLFKDNNYQIPSSWKSTIIKLTIVFIAYLMNQAHKVYPDKYTTTDEFMLHSFAYRLLYILICVELGTSKYYFAFSIGEAAANIVGISYNGKDENGNAKWDRIVMIRMWQFKTATNARGLVEHWNVPCQLWLKQYVFMRIIKMMNNRSLAVFGTFFVSAFWHGFYGGYYCFFLTGAFFELVADALGKNLHHIFENKDGSMPMWYRFMGWLLTFWAITYMAISFRLLSITLAFKAWSSIYFFSHIGGALILLIFYLFPQRPSKVQKVQ